MIRNPAKLREPSKEEGIINSTDSKSVCSQEVITNLRPETYTQSLLNVPNGDLVAVKINASNVQTNGQDLNCLQENRLKVNSEREQDSPVEMGRQTFSRFKEMPVSEDQEASSSLRRVRCASEGKQAKKMIPRLGIAL
ncbi:hypothetical protein TNCV_3446381 [Trichonephila clavipes]|nr:hypothetical protein TNCV_3446381 [Trichonephila clavipes]